MLPSLYVIGSPWGFSIICVAVTMPIQFIHRHDKFAETIKMDKALNMILEKQEKKD